MKKFFAIMLLSYFGFVGAFGQSSETLFDNFKAELLAEKNDTSLTYNYARLSFSYLNLNVDSATHYAKLCLDLSEKLDLDLGRSFGHSTMALCFASMNILDSAIIRLYLALDLYKKLNDTLGIADTYGNLSFIFDRTNQFEKAVEYGLLDKELRILKKDTLGLFNCLANLLTFYLNKGEIEEAEVLLEELIFLRQNTSGRLENMIVVQKSGELKFAKARYNEALSFFDEALLLMNPHSEKVDWAYVSSFRGKCLFHLGDYANAKTAIDTAIKIYEEIGSWVYKFDDYLFMARIDSATGNYKDALEWHIRYVEKELNRMDNQKLVELNLMQDQFESSLKEAENKALTDQNTFQELIISRQRIIGVAIIVCLVVLGLLAIYLLRVNIIIKQKSEILGSQKEQIESQNAKLERLNKVKSKMISIISHDFRSPLVSVQSTMSILEQMGKSENTFKQLLPELKSKVDYAAELVDNLLLWANDHMEDTNLNLEDFDLKSFIERKTMYFYELAKRKGVRLSVEELAETSLHTDKMMLHSVYRNLVSNALKFTPSGGEIRISAFESGDSVVFTVADSGIGMDEETQNTIRQGQSVSRIGTNKEMGSGLGLLICQDFIKRLKGTFHFDSNPGKGTQFYVQIPKSI
jgi:signal transduction histidine kinase